jgi:hypothetical protein
MTTVGVSWLGLARFHPAAQAAVADPMLEARGCARGGRNVAAWMIMEPQRPCALLCWDSGPSPVQRKSPPEQILRSVVPGTRIMGDIGPTFSSPANYARGGPFEAWP